LEEARKKRAKGVTHTCRRGRSGGFNRVERGGWHVRGGGGS